MTANERALGERERPLEIATTSTLTNNSPALSDPSVPELA